jgi:hypothetical protein
MKNTSRHAHGTWRGAGRSGDSATIAVVGRRHDLARRFETALAGKGYKFVYDKTREEALERSADLYVVDLLEAASSANIVQVKARQPARQSARPKQQREVESMDLLTATAVLSLLHELLERKPRPPILVAADEGSQADVIKKVLDLGVDDVISMAAAKIPELVRARVSSLLNAAARSSARSTFAAGSRVDTDDASERDATDAGPGESAAREEWEAPLSATEAKAALRRVREATLPAAGYRRGPIAELLHIQTPELRARSGRLDAKRVAKRLDVSLRDLAVPLGVSHQALSKTPDSERAQEGLDPIARTLGLLDEMLGRERERAWLNTPHARLGGETPLKALLSGRAEEVARMLGVVRDGGVPS